MRSSEAELVDQDDLRPPRTLAAEVDGLPVQATGDREVPGVNEPQSHGRGEGGLRIRHETGLRCDRRTGLGRIHHVAASGIAFEMEERASAVFTHSEYGQIRRHRGHRPYAPQLEAERSA